MWRYDLIAALDGVALIASCNHLQSLRIVLSVEVVSVASVHMTQCL